MSERDHRLPSRRRGPFGDGYRRENQNNQGNTNEISEHEHQLPSRRRLPFGDGYRRENQNNQGNTNEISERDHQLPSRRRNPFGTGYRRVNQNSQRNTTEISDRDVQGPSAQNHRAPETNPCVMQDTRDNDNLMNRVRELYDARLARIEGDLYQVLEWQIEVLERQLAEAHAQLRELRRRESNTRHRAFDRQRSRLHDQRPEWHPNHWQENYSTTYRQPESTSNRDLSNEGSLVHERQNYSQNGFNDRSYGPYRQDYDQIASNGSFGRPHEDFDQNYNQNFSYENHQNYERHRAADQTFDARRQIQHTNGNLIYQEPGTESDPDIRTNPPPG